MTANDGKFGFPILLLLAAGGCTRAPMPIPPAAPTPAPVARPAVAPTIATVSLGVRVPDTRWRVVTETHLRALSSNDAEQRVRSSAIVSWRFDRRSDGGMRGTGTVEDFRVQATFLAKEGVLSDSLLARMPLEVVLDSVTARVVTRPPLVNECDRLEAAAAMQARAAAVRVPERVQLGMVWRDSTVTFTCRSGVPIAIYTTSHTRVVAIDSSVVRLTRETVFQLRGNGAVAFRSLAVTGTGTGRAQIVLRRPEGTLDRLSETSTSRLTVTDTPTGRTPREQRMEQEVTLRVELLPRTR